MHNAIIQYLKLARHFLGAFCICETSVTDFVIKAGTQTEHTVLITHLEPVISIWVDMSHIDYIRVNCIAH